MSIETDKLVRAIMFIVIIILANAVFSLLKKESWRIYITRTSSFIMMSLITWFI